MVDIELNNVINSRLCISKTRFGRMSRGVSRYRCRCELVIRVVLRTIGITRRSVCDNYNQLQMFGIPKRVPNLRSLQM